ncbi:quinol monooxygenase YgiN [Parvibaculum indicum]|jgi:quinol monooxygenase YgiN|uniref:putative quinol monooxygenase n=2 Tax=Parvibaculum TaxID=256616 RepID=UPI001422268A|nr:putative quinol monooxygenase [Parvibaculum indicum]NIJ42009.1 quinol monooxygenase YgiN [Parvibaculum indicum]
MSVIGILATMKVQPGKESEFESVFSDLAKKVKANEKGCLQYDLFRSKSEPTTFYIYEQYASQADLEAHGKSEYFQAAFPALGATLAGKPDLQFLDKVE